MNCQVHLLLCENISLNVNMKTCCLHVWKKSPLLWLRNKWRISTLKWNGLAFIGVYITNRTLYGHLEKQNFSLSSEKYFTHSLCSIKKHSEINFVSPHDCVTSSVSLIHWMFSSLLHTVNETCRFHHKATQQLIALPLMMDQQFLEYYQVLNFVWFDNKIRTLTEICQNGHLLIPYCTSIN